MSTSLHDRFCRKLQRAAQNYAPLQLTEDEVQWLRRFYDWCDVEMTAIPFTIDEIKEDLS